MPSSIIFLFYKIKNLLKLKQVKVYIESYKNKSRPKVITNCCFFLFMFSYFLQGNQLLVLFPDKLLSSNIAIIYESIRMYFCNNYIVITCNLIYSSSQISCFFCSFQCLLESKGGILNEEKPNSRSRIFLHFEKKLKQQEHGFYVVHIAVDYRIFC